MIGGLLALVSAVTFAFANASVRRGVLTGTVLQAVAISVPVALPFFIIAMLLSGGFHLLATFSWGSIGLLTLAGVIHFTFARYCNYRATKAIGANLAAPLQQFSLIISLVLAVVWLGETVTLLRLVGIVLVVIGPALAHQPDNGGAPPATIVTDTDHIVAPFKPDYAEGYFFTLLSAVGFGLSPILIRLAFDNKEIAAGIAGGFVSYAAATVVIALLLALPQQRRSLQSIDGISAKWFLISGIAVAFSQMFRYMALAVAPVSVASPIQRLSIVFRIYFGSILNPHHEVFGGRIIWGTFVSLAGAIALSISADNLISSLWLPPSLLSLMTWHWP